MPTPVPFTYTNSTAATVRIAGSFNGWSTTANPMTKSGSTWTATINIPNGVHQYKLFVDGNYLTDPGNPFTAPDGLGGYNSRLAVGPLDEAATSVVTSDGRTVTYNYSMTTVGTTIYSQLTRVNYPDATYASYTYTQPFSGGRPLLKTVDDPRYQGPAKRLQYTYQNSGVEGFVFEENSLLTGTMLARVVPPTSETARTVLHGNGGSHTIALNTWQMTSRADSLNRAWINAYYTPGGESMLQSQTDPLGRTTSFERTYEFGVIKKIINPDLTWRAISFPDETHPFYPASTTDENGKVTNYTRDASHRITRIDYPDGGYETFTYNGNGQVLTHRLPVGSTETMTYDARRMLTSKIDGAGKTWLYTYDTRDRLATVKDPRMNITGYTYNDRGQTLRITNPGGSYREFTYDAYGNRLTATNELGKTWTYVFDEYSRVTSVTDPLQRVTQTSYGIGVSGCGSCHVDAFPTGITTQGSKQTVIAYNTEWQKTSETTGAHSGDAATVGYSYDLAGNLLTMTDARLKPWTNTYDTRNRRLTSKDPLNNETVWTYDGVGNALTVKRPDTGLTVNTYDALNRMLTTRNPNLELTQYAYDKAGNVTTLTDARLNAYGFTYDGLSRKTAMTYPGGTHEDWTYDPAGNVATYRNRSASIKTYVYDTRNRETSASGGGVPAVSRTYDNASRLLTLGYGLSSGTYITYTYDFANQLLSETQNVSGLGAKTVSYTYDLDGNRATLTYPGGKVTSYTYTQRNQPDTIAYDGPPPLVNYDYDLAGNRTLKTGENNTRTAYGYDDASRLGSVDHQRNVGGTWTSFQSFNYTLNTTGNRTDRYEANSGVTKRDKYTYDPNDQIDLVKYNFNGTTQDRTVDYNFDPVGNRSGVTDSAGQTPASYTTNTLNQYTSVASVGQSYDANGNQTVRGYPGPLYALQDSYQYDGQNRMTLAYIEQTFGGSSPMRQVATTYDARNRVVSRVFSDANSSGQITMYYVWDDWNLLVEYTSAGYGYPVVETRRYVHGAAVDEILLSIGTTPAQTVHHHHDGLGSVTALTDASGSLVERYTYDVFGTPAILNATGTTLTASGYGNRFLFTGREWIKEMGLYDYRNRVYSASQGRFLQTDPIRFNSGDANLMRYVRNEITDYFDPSGLAGAPAGGAGKASAHEEGVKKGVTGSVGGAPGGPNPGTGGGGCSVSEVGQTKPADVTVGCSARERILFWSRSCPGTQTCPFILECKCSASSGTPGTPVTCDWVIKGPGEGLCTPCVKK